MSGSGAIVRGAIVLGGDYPAGNCLGSNFPSWQLPGGQFSGGRELSNSRTCTTYKTAKFINNPCIIWIYDIFISKTTYGLTKEP